MDRGRAGEKERRGGGQVVLGAEASCSPWSGVMAGVTVPALALAAAFAAFSLTVTLLSLEVNPISQVGWYAYAWAVSVLHPAPRPQSYLLPSCFVTSPLLSLEVGPISQVRARESSGPEFPSPELQVPGPERFSEALRTGRLLGGPPQEGLPVQR